MAITFDCECGKTLRVPDEHTGRRVRCPACSAVATVPQPEPEFEVVENPSEPLAPPPKPTGRPVAKPAPSQTTDDDDDDRAYGVTKSKPSSRDDDEEEERPRKKKKKRRERFEDDPRPASGGATSGGVAGGALMMLIAIVWFVLGLMNDWVFFYPPILFILGLVAFIKGLAGEE